MSYTAQLILKLHSTQTKTPDYRVILNDQIQTASDLVEGQVVVNATPNFNNNTLLIEFLNKEPADTIVDSNNDVVLDLAVEVVKLTIDDIDFTDWIKNEGVYKDSAGAQHATHGYMHTNGTLEFEFICPGFYFIRNLAVTADQILEPVVRHDNY